MFIERKIKKLLEVCSTIPYVEYYPHENGDCFKIDNPFTDYNKDTIVLCLVNEGFGKAVRLALPEMIKRKTQLFDEKTK